MSQKLLDLSVLIVTYKTKDMVLDCIESSKISAKQEGLNFQIVVVDNGSDDGTVETIKDEHPDVHLIANLENVGPAKAYNQALKASLDSSKYVLLLNSDIIVWSETIGNMYNYLEAHPEISGVCGDLLWPNGERQKIRTHIWSFKKADYTKRFPATFIGSGFNMTRSKAFREVGLYDENYYFYNEDLDWVERANRKGLKFMFLPDAKVYHYQGQGSKQNYSAITKELYKSNLYYFQKFYGPLIANLAYWGMLAEIKMKRNRLIKDKTDSNITEERNREINQSLTNLLQGREELVRFKREGKV